MGKWGKITENGSDSSRLLEKRALVRLMAIHNTGGSRMEKDVTNDASMVWWKNK